MICVQRAWLSAWLEYLPLAKPGEQSYSFGVPRKIRELVADLERSGFALIKGGKGSHRKFVHPNFKGFVLISGREGDDAKPYQEKQVRDGLEKIGK